MSQVSIEFAERKTVAHNGIEPGTLRIKFRGVPNELFQQIQMTEFNSYLYLTGILTTKWTSSWFIHV